MLCRFRVSGSSDEGSKHHCVYSGAVQKFIFIVYIDEKSLYSTLIISVEWS